MTASNKRELCGAALGLREIDIRFAATIDCRDDFHGYAMAARTILQCVKSARATYPQQVALEWLQTTEEHSQRVNRCADKNKLLSTVDDTVARDRIYGAFAKPAKANLSTSALSRINSAIGVIVLSTAVQSRTISPSVISAWIRLQKCGTPRAGRHPDWENLAKNFPTTREELSLWTARANEPEMVVFLKTLEIAVDTPLLSPMALETEGSNQGPADSKTSNHNDASTDTTTENEQNESRTVPEPPPSYVGWLIQRANQSGFLSHLGLEDRWEKQTPDELKFVCKGIDTALGGSPVEQRFSLFAVLSLSSGLPANLLIKVKLRPNSDLWVDCVKGCIHWCLLRALDHDKAKAIEPADIPRSQIVDIWLPKRSQMVAHALASSHSGASNVIELISGNSEEIATIEFLDQYRAWLTSLGARSLHYMYDARFARSFGQIYRAQSNDVVAAFLSLDFEECSMGMLHYIRFSRRFLYEQTTAALQAVGLGPPVETEDLLGSVGSNGAMDFDVFIEGLIGLTHRRETALADMLTAETADSALERFTDLAHCDQLMELSLSAGRDQHLERLTWGNLLGHPEFIIRADKDLDQYTKFRVAPAHCALKAILNSHATAKTLFCKKLEQLGVHPRSPRGLRFDDNSPHLTFFATGKIVVIEGSTYLKRHAIDTNRLQVLSSRHFNGFVNVGRHTLVSILCTTELDPWLLKTLTGHYRGQCEPFSDGQCTPPVDAMRCLQAALDTLFQPFLSKIGIPASEGTVRIQTLRGRLPSGVGESIRAERSRARVLAAPFDGYTLLSLRIVDHLSHLLEHGMGPSHAGANLLLNLLIGNWILLSDLKIIWSSPSSFQQLTPGCGCAVWTRPNCIAEIRLALTAASLIAIGNLKNRGSDRTWEAANTQTLHWLRCTLPGIAWPDVGEEAVARLSALMSRWLRFKLPPFLLASASPKLTSATASRTSLIRLINSVKSPSPACEVLNFPKPKPRGKSNLRFAKSKLKDAIALVHEFANPQLHAGEDWALMKELCQRALEIDCSMDLAAATFVKWVQMEAALWVGSQRGRIQVSSLSTYTYLLAPVLVNLTPIHNPRDWDAEWFDFIDMVRKPHGIKTTENSLEKIEERLTAAKRFVGKLKSVGYAIPDDLFENFPSAGADGMRRSAASSLILDTDRVATRSLMINHFGECPLESRLAGLYVDLRFGASSRSIEAAVLPLDAIDEFNNLVVTTDGFSHLKSDHARRIQALPDELVTVFRTAVNTVRAARPDSRWLFLMDDRSDWRLIVEFERAFSAALKQVTLDFEAVPHSSRSVSPLTTAVPGWQDIGANMLNGTASRAEYESFLGTLANAGFTNIARVLLKIGHGHPITYLKYYFAIWDILMSVHRRALEMHANQSHALICSSRQPYRLAYEKARQRKGPAFNGTQWLIAKELQSLDLPKFDHDNLSQPATPSRHPVQPDKAIPIRDKVRYLAARFAQLESDAAASNFKINTRTVAELEGMFSAASAEPLLRRHQSKVSKRGRDAEVQFLKSAAGALLTRQLLQTEQTTLENLGEALSPKRTYKALPPSVTTLETSLTTFLACLPVTLGILIQFAPSRHTTPDLARLSSLSKRIQIGGSDPDLGARPRISVVEAGDPSNLVLRARRTSSTRCIVAAILLLTHR